MHFFMKPHSYGLDEITMETVFMELTGRSVEEDEEPPEGGGRG